MIKTYQNNVHWINKLRRDKRAKYYKPLLLIIVIDFLNDQKYFSPIVPSKIIVERFEGMTKLIGLPSRLTGGWMPFWHLSGDRPLGVPIWIHYSSNHELVKKSAFVQSKPKSKKQLLSKVNYALINKKYISDFENENNREKLRNKIYRILKKDKNFEGQKILEYYNV